MTHLDKAEAALRDKGYFDEGLLHGSRLGRSAIELLKVFESQGHSALSAEATLKAFAHLVRDIKSLPHNDMPPFPGRRHGRNDDY